jgi:HEAT repeat
MQLTTWLVTVRTCLLQTQQLADFPSGDVRTAIVNSAAIPAMITLMEDPNWNVRNAVTTAITKLAAYRMNLLRATTIS